LITLQVALAADIRQRSLALRSLGSRLVDEEKECAMKTSLSRRHALRWLGGLGVAGLVAACGGAPAPSPTAAPAAPKAAATPPPAAGQAFELIHWSWLTASDGEIWQKNIENFNKENAGKLQIKMDVLPSDQYGVKVLAGVAANTAPDFGWGNAGARREWQQKGVTVAMDDYLKGANLDFADFTEGTLERAKYDGKIYVIPLDGMSFQMLINTDHAKQAGLDISKPPKSGEELLLWADKMTKREGDKVNRAGFLMTGSGIHIALVWGIVFEQLGGRRLSDDLKTVTLNRGDAAKQATQWVLDLFDKRKVSSRDVADRYKAFGTGQGSMFWTGPWTLPGYIKQEGLSFMAVELPMVGKELRTVIELGGMEMYKQEKAERYPKSAEAIKWLSDNSFYWCTSGRGTALRKSVLARPDFKTAGTPWEYRRPFVEGMSFAKIGPVPLASSPDWQYYSGTGAIAKNLDPVWAGQKSIEQGLADLEKAWQEALARG
jgi:ABC-type glycerol-3-phosphate transport system substrate-binding protein